MTVAAILSEKGREVVTVRPEFSVSEVAEILDSRKIGAAVVVDQQSRPIGIVSERDVVRALARFGAKALELQAGAIMTGKLVTCAETETIDDVMHRMTLGRFRHLPVVVNARMVGIISIGDVVKKRIEDVEREAEHMRAYIATA